MITLIKISLSCAVLEVLPLHQMEAILAAVEAVMERVVNEEVERAVAAEADRIIEEELPAPSHGPSPGRTHVSASDSDSEIGVPLAPSPAAVAPSPVSDSDILFDPHWVNPFPARAPVPANDVPGPSRFSYPFQELPSLSPEASDPDSSSEPEDPLPPLSPPPRRRRRCFDF